MKCRQFTTLAFSALLLVGSVVRAADNPPVDEQRALHNKKYNFQHRVLPKWTHGTNGAFYEDLRKGSSERLISAATEIVSKEFAQHLTVRRLPELQGVLITFQKPVEAPECYFVLIVKQGERYRYYTLEMGVDLFKTGVKSVIGEWVADGSHLNFGPRTYDDEASFIADPSVKPEKR